MPKKKKKKKGQILAGYMYKAHFGPICTLGLVYRQQTTKARLSQQSSSLMKESQIYKSDKIVLDFFFFINPIRKSNIMMTVIAPAVCIIGKKKDPGKYYTSELCFVVNR